jgi:hypothetical protein
MVIVAIASLAVTGTALADTWFPAASMSEPRAGQTATLLANGQVLVAGGYNGFIANIGGSHTNLDLAELFDVSTGAWTKAAPMLIPRSFQTATPLLDGRVLVIGGWETPPVWGKSAGEEHRLTAEAYDPASNSWTSIPTPEELQVVGSATRLPSGWVFLTGLFGSNESEASEGAALYDPAANVWERTAPSKHPREGTATLLLENGNVLMIGGVTSEHLFPPVHAVSTVLPIVEEYDPHTNEWVELKPMKEARTQETTTLMPGGDVLVTGGVNQINDGFYTYSAVSSTEMYDPTTNTWTALAPMAIAREQHTATLLPEGDVLVAGGGDCGGGQGCLGYGGSGDCCGASSAELYDPSTNSWSFTPPVLSGVEHTATLIPGGDLLITGGNLEPINTYELSSAEIYASRYPPDEPHTVANPQSAATSTTTTTAPTITSATQSHRTWSEGNTPAHARASKSKPPIGTTFSFTLNEQASVSFAFTQRTSGREVEGKCIAQTKQNSRRPACKRTVTRGTLSLTGHVGSNSVFFAGRLSRLEKLTPGDYTLVITARNTTGERSDPKSLSFTIVK